MLHVYCQCIGEYLTLTPNLFTRKCCDFWEVRYRLNYIHIGYTSVCIIIHVLVQFVSLFCVTAGDLREYFAGAYERDRNSVRRYYLIIMSPFEQDRLPRAIWGGVYNDFGQLCVQNAKLLDRL